VSLELGPLADDDEQAARLRETLAAFLAEGGRWRATAARLGLHENTVLGRVRRIEALLGRRCTARRFELEAALRLRRELDVDFPQTSAAALWNGHGDTRPASS
jgi:DNA-binding PucR family transcriptional regulator